VASNKAVLPLLLRLSFRQPPFSGRPRRQCGIPALPLALLPTAAHLRPTAPPIPPATSARAYRATTDTHLGQENHQKWCFSPGSVDLCNLSLFRRCTRTTLLPKRQIRRSESRSEEITAVQASTRLQKDLPVCQRASRAPTRHHGDPRASTRRTVFPRAGTHRQHLPRSPTRFGTISRGFRVPRAYWCVSCTRFLQPQDLRVHHTRQAFFPGHALTGAWDARALAASILWRVLYTRQALLITILLPRVS
jgi:hypothetical protein